MSNNNQIAIREFLGKNYIQKSFADVLGDDRSAQAHIKSVLIAVLESSKLQECTHESIYASALRAATLRLSVDPAKRQAYLIPYGKKCTLQVSYKGLYDLAIRTNKYRYINVYKIYEGQEIIEEFPSGFHRPDGQKKNNTVIGLLGAYELIAGFGKTIYMTIDEIHDHKKKYSKSWDDPKSTWSTNHEIMEYKTVLRRLLGTYGTFDESDQAILDEIEAENAGDVNGEDEPIDLDFTESKSDYPAKMIDLVIDKTDFIITDAVILLNQMEIQTYNKTQVTQWLKSYVLGLDTDEVKNAVDFANAEFKKAKNASVAGSG